MSYCIPNVKDVYFTSSNKSPILKSLKLLVRLYIKLHVRCKVIVLFRIMFIEKLKFHSENDIQSLFVKQPKMKGYNFSGPYLDSPRSRGGYELWLWYSLKKDYKFKYVYIFSQKTPQRPMEKMRVTKSKQLKEEFKHFLFNLLTSHELWFLCYNA